MFDEYQGEMKLGNPDEETQAPETVVSNDSTSTRPLEDIQSEKNMFQGIKTAYDVLGLSFGDGVDIASRNKAFEKFPDYKDNKEFYDAYADTDVWYRSHDADKIQRQVIDKYVDDGRFMLDENGEVAMADGSPDAVLWLYDTKAIKGALLARHNGFDKQAEEDAYKEEAKAESERLAKEMQGVDLADQIIGTVAGYMFRQETAIEMAGSPAKIIGKGILKTAGKAFVTEGMVGLIGETLREKNIREHMAKQNLDYSLWESTKHILINAGFAGSLRGAGSYMLDGIAMFTKGKSAANGMKFEQLDEADQSLLKMYVDREQRKLTTNSKLHLDLMQKAEDDINKGKKVDVSDFTDIDIETKIPEQRDAVSMPDEIVNINTENRVYEDVKSIQDSVEETMNMKIDEDVLDGMATEKEFSDVIKETIDIDPEIESELKAIQAEEKRLNSRAEEVKSVSEIPLGGSEDETKQAVQNMFKKNTSEKYKNMTKDDVAYLDKQHEEDLQREAETVFAKFGDNLTAGTIAGVDEDENGNLTFDPAKFAAGLGGYTALKQIIKVPAVKKEMRGYFERLFDSLDNNPKFNLLVGKQQAYASDRMTAIAKKHFPDTDDAGFTKEDYLFVNKAARTLENMDKQLKKEGVEQVEESTKSLEQIISELLEDAQVMNGTRGEATDFGTGRKIDLGVDNPPVTHPMPKDKKKAAEELDKIYGEKEKKGILERKAAEKAKAGLPKEAKKVYHPTRDKNYMYDEKTDTVYFERKNGTWKEMPNEEIRSDVKFIKENGVKSYREKLKKEDAEFKSQEEKAQQIEQEESYKDMHKAPTRGQDNATSIDDLTAIYPSDVYGANAARYYGHGDKYEDARVMAILKSLKGKPDKLVTIYRAIPENIDATINKDDWVTISKQYAKDHGENRFDGKYKIIEKKVKASDLFTDGNSIYEQGYSPKDK